MLDRLAMEGDGNWNERARDRLIVRRSQPHSRLSVSVPFLALHASLVGDVAANECGAAGADPLYLQPVGLVAYPVHGFLFAFCADWYTAQECGAVVCLIRAS